MLSLELGIVTVLIVLNGLLAMSELAIVSSRPARLAGLAGKGSIAVGKDADLVAFAPDERFIVGALHHRNPVTPYAGRELTGVVRRTWLRGQLADGSPIGRLLRRGMPE